MDWSLPGLPVPHHLPEFPKFMSIASVKPSSHLILWCLLLLLTLIFPSIRWPKYWSFTFSISPSNEYLGLISFKIGWFDLPAVSGTFKSLLQDFSLKASILQHAAFFMFPFSQPYMTTEKTIALTMRTFVGKAMSLLFDTLSRFDLAFLPRSNHLLISWLQSPSSVISGAPKEKICHCFQFSPFHLPWVGLDASIFFLFF